MTDEGISRLIWALDRQRQRLLERGDRRSLRAAVEVESRIDRLKIERRALRGSPSRAGSHVNIGPRVYP